MGPPEPGLPQDKPKPAFISRQVTRGDYFFLNLNPSPREDLVIVCGGNESCSQQYVIERPSFEFHSIEFVAQGQGRLTLGRNTFDLHPGSLFYYSPETPHRISNASPGPLVKFFLTFSGARASSLLLGTPLAHAQPCQIAQYHWVHDLFSQLIDSGKTGGPNVHKVCRHLFLALLERIQQLSVSTPAFHSRGYHTYERCRSYLLQHYTNLANIQNLADSCGVSLPYLSRLFKKYGSTTPSQMLLQYKMNHAADLLVRSHCLVKEAAEQVGFSDQYYFSRAFKKCFGVPPRVFTQRLSGY